MVNRRWLAILLLVLSSATRAQELQARITVNASQVSSQVDKKVFQTLQSALNDFLNNRKWTTTSFQANEKIVCNFLLAIQQTVQDNVYKATLTVQAARPIYNSTYQSPLINYRDESFTFKYVEYQPVEFNENRVSGSDGLVSNLPATLAFYAYLILGLDFDSFSLHGGDPYYQKALLIVNNAPEGRDIEGWRAFDGSRNRYWLMENMTNSRYNLIHDVIYNYYRLGLDFMYENEDQGRTAIMNTISMLNTLNNDVPNTMIIPFFFQGKSPELIRILKKAQPDDKSRAREILIKVDISNANSYKQELK